MHRSARALAVMLTIAMVASVLPIGLCSGGTSKQVTEDLVADAADLVMVKDGMTVTLHKLTTDDVDGMRASMGVKDPTRNYNVLVDGMGTGLAPPSDSEYDRMVGQYALVAAQPSDLGELPSTFDLSLLNTFPKVGNQGTQGSCAAWAMTYYCYGAIEAADNGWTSAKSGTSSQLISPAWTYNRVNDYDHGSSMAGNGWVLEDWGAPTMATMPYNAADAAGWGNENAMREAPLHRANNVVYASDYSTDTIKSIVQSGKPVTFALDANQYSACFSDNTGSKIISAAEYSPNTPNHAQTIVGWDDSISDDETGAFRVVNSWGTSWGESGFYWVTYSAFAEMVPGYQPVYIEDRADYTPSMMAVWHYDSPPGRDTSFTVRLQNNNTGANVASCNYYYRSSFSYGSILKHSSYMAVDISDFAASYSSTNCKFAIEYSGGASQGTISSFKVERYDGGYSPGQATHISRQASGLPKTTTGSVTTYMAPYAKLTSSEALDVTGMSFSSSGAARWVPVVHQSMNGGDALQSGDVPDGKSSRLTTSVTGPCTVEFDWMVASESGDNFVCFLDGSAQSTISGTTNWAHLQISVPSGAHTVEWVYTKNSANSRLDDCAYLDKVYLSSGGGGDITPPQTTVSLDGTSGSNGWYRSSVAVTLSATDASGIASTSYRLNGGSWQAYTSTFTVSSDGINTLEFYSVDVSGNSEGVQSSTIMLDKVAPSTTSSLSSYTVTLTPSDATSGVYRTFYRVDSGSWTLYSAPFSAGSSGQHTVQFNSTDNAGNVEVTKQVTVGSSDTTPPITTASLSGTSGQNGWYVGPVTVTLTATDSSGVSSRHYRLDGGSWNTYTTPFSIGSDGTRTVEYYSVDTAGNSEPVKSVTVKVDTTKPSTSQSVSSYTVTLTPSDATSGVYRTFYRVNSGAWNLYSSPFSAGSSGQHTVQFNSTDNAGNVEVTKQVTVGSSDTTPPITTASLSGTSGQNGWYTSAVTVTLTASDSSGISSRNYRLDGGSWNTYTSSFSISSDGTHTVEYYSIDIAGNTESVKSVTVKVDTTKPSTSHSVSSYTVTLTPSDATSGVHRTFYRINSGAWSLYSSPFSAGATGQHTVQFNSTDSAGNVEVTKQVTVGSSDTTPPSTTASLSGTSGQNGWYVGPVTVTLTASDSSGISSRHYRIDSGTWTDYSSAFTVSGEGTHTVEFYSIDMASNTESVKSVTFKIDTVKPITNGSASGYTVTLSANDATSGVGSIYYRVGSSGGFSTYSSPFSAGAPGQVYTVHYYSLDKAGNTESARSMQVGTADTTPPTTSVTVTGTIGGSNWFRSSVTIALSASDDTSVYRTYFRWQGASSWSTYSSSFSSSTEGDRRLEYYSLDSNGNSEAVKSVRIKIDRTAPTSSSSVSGGTVSLYSSDALSGPSYIEYRVDGGTWTTYTTAFIISPLWQAHNVEYRAVDVAGNLEGTRSRTVGANDETAPSTTVELVGTEGSSGWYRSAVSVVLTAGDDASGVERTWYSLDGGAWSVPAGAFIVMGDGVHRLQYYSIDKAGNVETQRSLSIGIDTVAPVTSHQVDNALVSLAGTDAASGLASIHYRFDTGTDLVYRGLITIPDPYMAHMLYYHGHDQAGNTEVERSVLIPANNGSEPLPPGPPAALQVSLVDGSVTLQWTIPEDDGGSPIIGYKVLRGTAAGEETLLGTTLETHYSDGAVTAGSTYYYVVKANNSVGDSVASEEVSMAVLVLPSAPLDLELEGFPGGVLVSWSAPLSDGGLPISGYLLIRGSSPGATEAIVPLTSSMLSYTDDEVEGGKSYYYRVKAMNSLGVGPECDEGSVLVPYSMAPPRSFSAQLKAGTVHLNWSAPTGSEPTAYQVLRAIGTGSAEVLADVAGPGYEDHDLMPGLTYRYSIGALYGDELGPLSIVLEVSVPNEGAELPFAPEGLNAMAAPGGIALDWNYPFADRDQLSGFKVFRSTAADMAYAAMVKELNDTAYLDKGALPGVTYYYQVRAVNAEGEGAASVSVSASRPADADSLPGMPAGLQVTTEGTMVMLAWSQPVTEGSAGLLGYRVYRSVNEDDPKLLATVDGSNYVDHTTLPGRTYRYWVSAYNAMGEGEMTESVSTSRELDPIDDPMMPQDLTARMVMGQVELAWEVPGDLPLSYRIYRGTGPGDLVLIATVDGNVRTFIDLEGGEGNYYSVTAVFEEGDGPFAPVQKVVGAGYEADLPGTEGSLLTNPLFWIALVGLFAVAFVAIRLGTRRRR